MRSKSSIAVPPVGPPGRRPGGEASSLLDVLPAVAGATVLGPSGAPGRGQVRSRAPGHQSQQRPPRRGRAGPTITPPEPLFIRSGAAQRHDGSFGNREVGLLGSFGEVGGAISRERKRSELVSGSFGDPAPLAGFVRGGLVSGTRAKRTQMCPFWNGRRLDG